MLKKETEDRQEDKTHEDVGGFPQDIIKYLAVTFETKGINKILKHRITKCFTSY